MAAQLDLYAECNVDGAPLDAFVEGCCKRCFNSDCTRATFARGPFEQRVLNWEERLFLNPPKMSESDPRFPTIAQQFFAEVPVTRKAMISVPSEWHDPRDLAAAAAAAAAAPPADLPTETKALPEPPTAGPQPPAEAPRTAAPGARGVSNNPLSSALNTPRVAPRMLDGAPAQAKAPPADPWTAKPPPADPWNAPAPAHGPGDERVVPRGAKIRLKE
jgi:hypothetical protein